MDTTWLLITIVALFAVFFLKNIQKHFVLKSIKLVIIIVLVILAFIFISNYVDLGSLFEKESPFVKTGAAVVDAVKDNFN